MRKRNGADKQRTELQSDEADGSATDEQRASQQRAPPCLKQWQRMEDKGVAIVPVWRSRQSGWIGDRVEQVQYTGVAGVDCGQMWVDVALGGRVR